MAARSLIKIKIKIGVFVMAEEKEQRYRVSAYVSGATYEKLMAMQAKERMKQNKKVSQGQILDEVFKKI